MAKRRRQTAYQKATKNIATEGRKQCFMIYSAAALALYRHWNKKHGAIIRLFELTGDVWRACADDGMRSMIQLCEEETGIEIQNGDGKSWRDLPYMNATLDTGRMSNAQWVYMRMQQAKWVAPQVVAYFLVALHRKYGFGYERCARIYGQIQEIEAEYGMDPEKLQAACLAETGVNVIDTITQTKKEGQKVV